MTTSCPEQTLMNATELRQWVLRRLGAPIHKVELCEEHVTDAVEQARRWFSAKKGTKKTFAIMVIPQQVEYPLDDEVDVVLDVAFSEQKLDLSLVFSPFTLLEEKIPYDVFASGGSGGLYSSYVQSLQYIEMAKRILSAELEWRQEGRNLNVAPIPVNARTILMDAKIRCVKIEDLSERDHDLVKRYALAKAREDISWVLGRYGSFPGAQGDISFNWDMMRDAAQQEIERLEEEIFLSAGPMGFLTG